MNKKKCGRRSLRNCQIIVWQIVDEHSTRLDENDGKEPIVAPRLMLS